MKTLLTATFLAATLYLGPSVHNAHADIILAIEDGSTTIDLSMGESGTIGVYVNDDFSIDTGAFLDAFGGDGISITGATVFNPEIVVGGTTVDNRWQFTDNGSVVGDDVINFNGFSVTEGTGILLGQATGGTFEDSGHVPGRGFLFAELSWELSGAADLGGDNVATIELGIGSGLIVNDGVALNPTFGNFTITSAVPEPSSAAMLALGLLGSVVRRRRKTIFFYQKLKSCRVGYGS